MQTFLPVANFCESAKYLDKARLGKQRVEAMQILSTLSGASRGWINHPAVRMWRGIHTEGLRDRVHSDPMALDSDQFGYRPTERLVVLLLRHNVDYQLE